MSSEPDHAAFHLLLDDEESAVTASALRLLIAGEAHQQQIRALAREVITGLDVPADEHGVRSVALAPGQMKITHTALHLLFDDLRRGQSQEIEVLRRVLEKLPDEHAIRAIVLD